MYLVIIALLVISCFLQFYDIPRDELAISSLENSVVTRLAVKDVS